MKRSATGERLWREFRVRVVIPGTKDIVWRSHPPAKRGYSAADLDKMLDQVAEHLEKRFPSIEFRMVELGPNVFNFIYEGRKELSEPVKNPCPSNAVASEIAREVCAVSGHSIAALANGHQVGPNGIVPMSITICTKCGIGLNEIREGVDRAFNMAVAEGVKQAVAALPPPPVPGAGGPFPVPDKPVAEPV